MGRESHGELNKEVKASLRKVIMKRWIAVGVLSAVALTSVIPAVEAGQREWATAGKVLTGVVAGSLLVRALEPAPQAVYQAPPPQVVYQQPVVIQQPQVVAPPPQVVYVQAPAPQTVYVAAPPQVVYYAAPPVVYLPAPVCYAPRPRVIVGFGHGYGHHRHW